MNELQSSLASTLPSNIDNSLQSTYVLPSSQLRSLPTAAVSHSKAALPSYSPSRAPIASTGNVFHPISGMSFSNFSLLNSQPSVNVHPKVNTSKVAQASTVINNSARLDQQPNPRMPFSSVSATQPPIYPVPSPSNFDPNILQSFLESQIAHESLPKFELDVFSGDPLKWPEWKGMFESTCCKPSVSLDHRMRYLKLFTSGKAKATIDGFGYLGVHFDQAFSSLQKRFGDPHIIVGAQIEKLSKHPQVKMHNSASIIEFSQVVNSFVSVLSAEKFFSDLQSSSNLSLVVSKLPIILRESWFGFIERLSVVNLITFRDWLQQKAAVHERLLMSITSNFAQLEKNVKLRKHQVLASNVVKTSNNNQSANVRKDQCPSCNQSHKIWKCSSFLSKSVKQRFAFGREKQLCFTCLQSGHLARDCSSKLKCRKSGCGKSHNSLLHNDTSSVVSGSKNENGVTSCTVSRSRKGTLQVIEIGLKSGSSSTKAWAPCDTGSTHSWVSEDVKSCLGLVGSSETVCVRGVTGSLEGDTSCVNLELFSLEDESFISWKFSALVRAGLSLGDEKLDLKSVKSCCPHLNVIKADVIDYSKISVILGQDVYSAICQIGYQTSDNHLPWAVKLPIGWVLSGPLPNCKSLKSSVCFASSGACVDESVDLDLATQVSKWWALESYASFVSVDPRSKSDKKALETLEKIVSLLENAIASAYCGILMQNRWLTIFLLQKVSFYLLNVACARTLNCKLVMSNLLRMTLQMAMCVRFRSLK